MYSFFQVFVCMLVFLPVFSPLFVIMRSFWGPSGVVLGSFWCHFGAILRSRGQLGTNFPILVKNRRSKCQNYGFT